MAGQYADVPYIGPPRSYNSTSYAKRYVVIHNTSNDASARGEAGYATRRVDGVSAHYYGDRIELIQSLSTVYGANHVGSSMGNRYGVAYEITGSNDWSRAQWLANVAWPLISRQIARDMVRHRIPAQLLTVAQMRQGTPGGMVTHDQCRQAWGGTDHTDPGPSFPLDYLLSLVRQQLAGSPAQEDDDMIGFAMNGDKMRKHAGGFTFPTSQREREDVISLADQGVIGPVSRRLHGNIGYGNAFGYPIEQFAKDLAAEVIGQLPAGSGGPALTAEEIEEACRKGVTGLALG